MSPIRPQTPPQINSRNPNGGSTTPRAPASPLEFKHPGAARNARVVKKQPRLEKAKLEKKEKTILALATKVSTSSSSSSVGSLIQRPFPFLALPGELRNEIYRLTTLATKQVLLIHLPKRASLRPRSSINAPNYADDLDIDDMDPKDAKRASKKKKNIKDKDAKKEPFRPFHALTHVCRQIRAEYRPKYMMAQEVGLDLVHIGEFIACFYPLETRILSNLGELTTVAATTLPMKEPSPTGPSTPFLGNLTIALSSTLKSRETGLLGTDILPLLDVWANSERIEAGFGRYHDPNCDRGNYRPENDGEAKDLYRLFGRKVETGRKCGKMNMNWREILRGRWLAEVRIVRQPTVGHPTAAEPTPGGPRSPTAPIPQVLRNGIWITPYVPNLPRPFIHVLFKQSFKEPWMTSEDAAIPDLWLDNHGFGEMEHFFLKVGAIAK